MKRSEMVNKIIETIEMVNKIIETIEQSYGNDGQDILYPPDGYLAEVILRTIEAAGMRPPPQEIYKISTLEGESLGQLEDVYEWDSENE